MALPTPEEILGKKKKSGLPTPEEILGGGKSKTLPTPDEVLGGINLDDYFEPEVTPADKAAAFFNSSSSQLSSAQGKLDPKSSLINMTLNTDHKLPELKGKIDTIRLAGQEFEVSNLSDHPSRQIPVVGKILQGLDKFEEFVRPANKIAAELYTPGAGAANTAMMVNNLGAKLASRAPIVGQAIGGVKGGTGLVGNTLGNRVATEAIKEGVTGIPLAAGNALVRGEDMDEVAKQAALGGVGGAVIGGALPIAGKAISSILPKRSAQTTPLASRVDDVIQSPVAAEPHTATASGEIERGFATTLRESEKTPQGFVDRLKSMYTPQSNEETLSMANARINRDVEEATSFVMSGERFTAEKAATAQRLIDHYNGQGNYQRAVDIAEKVSEEATKAGQAIQSLSMFNRLTPEGVLVYAQRMARKANEGIPVGAKEVKVTEDVASQLTGLAQATRKMTGIENLSNNVMDILERAKTGEKLSDADTSALKRFVEESRQFVKETSRKPKPPRAPKMPKDKRVRDNVVSFLDAQEQAAKERLRSKGIQISSTPLDVWADYAVIGAAKMGKGAVRFADWSEVMVKEMGESIRPHLEILYERATEAFEESTKKVTRKTIDKAEQLTEKVIKGQKLEGSEADSLRTMAKRVSDLSGEAKRVASQDLQAVLQALDRPSMLRRVSSIQTIGQLLNPKTQVRNALGNELFYRVERLNKYLSTPIDIARSKLTGGPRTVTFRTNNQGEYWKNWMHGLKAGWKGVNVQGLQTQYDLGSPSFKSKLNPLTYLEKALGASLKSFDVAAYMRAYNNTMGEQATLKLINEGKKVTKDAVKKIIREADDNLASIADEYGRYVTFQDNNIISKGMVAAKKGLNLGKDWGMGDLILKYPKTPGALLHRALEYSPAGFVRSAAIMARPWFKKEPNTAEVVQSLSRAIIGTFGLTGMGYFLMDKGILTGAASQDRDIRELQRSAGQGQYQINLSALKRFVTSNFNREEAKIKEGDLLYTYDWMQPVSMAISIGANTNKNIREGEGSLAGLAGTAYNSLEGGLGTLTEQSVLQGLKSAAEGYPGQTVTDKIADILSDIPSSFVPTGLNQIRQIQDPYSRETYDPSKLQQSLNRARNRLPFGGSEGLPQQYDTLGREKKPYQENTPFNVMFNPGFASRYQLSPEAKYIVDLIEETGDETLAPRAPSKSITIDGVNIKLTGEEYSRIQQYQGEATRNLLEKRMKRDSNKRLEKKSDKVKDVLTDAGKDARKKLKKEMEGR